MILVISLGLLVCEARLRSHSKYAQNRAAMFQRTFNYCLAMPFATAAWILGSHLAVAAKPSVVSQHDIVPLMQLRCTVCHGLRKQEAKLDLRTRESMLRGG